MQVVPPRADDPRLMLSAIIIALQVLGQTALRFKVSVAQILVTVGVCAVVELATTAWRARVLAWPASGVLTGNSVAFILRANGTRHGDLWTLHGIQYFLLAAGLSMLSKYLIRAGRRHLFNPSNVGIVGCLLIAGPTRVFPQYLWWGPWGWRVGSAVVVIVVGAIVLLRRVGMVGMSIGFLATFAVLIDLLAAGGHRFIASWHAGPVSGVSYWGNLVLSPEILVFVFFMMSDPRTAPAGRGARVSYGIATAVIASWLISMQATEYAIKVSILAALTLVCVAVPLLNRVTAEEPVVPRVPVGRWARALVHPVVVMVVAIAVAVPVRTVALRDDGRITLLDHGPTPGSPPEGSGGGQ